MMPAPDRDTMLRQWEASNAAGKTGAADMREAERILAHTEPDLMARYTELTRDGAKPGEAMARAMRDATANPNPPAQVPATSGWAATAGDPAAGGGGGAWQAVSQVLTRKKGAAA